MDFKNICIGAIGTDIGKSCVSAALCEAFGYEYFKLIQAGSISDESYIKTLSPKTFTHSAGIYLQTAASPHVGMKRENISYDGLSINLPSDKNLLVELSGGLFCPLDESKFMIDYVASKSLPIFLVVKNYLGSINHTVLSIKALNSYKIKILGIIVSGDRDEESESYLMEKFSELNFFFLSDINSDFKGSLASLKEQILSSNLKDIL